MPPVAVESEQQFNELTNDAPADQLVVLYFHTDWAEPCKHMTDVFASLAGLYSDHLFLMIDADKLPEVSEMLDVSAVPYFVLLRDKTIIRELSGADPKGLSQAIQAASGADEVASNAATGNSSTGTNSPHPEPAEESQEELENRLRKLISAAPVMLFMKGTPAEPRCGFSRQLVAILRENQVRFGFFDILKDNTVRQGLKEFSDWPTFPQLYVNGELQGGLDIVKESLEEDPEFFAKVALGG